MNQKLFDKYISNSCAPQKVDLFFNWITNNSNKLQIYNLLLNYWNELKDYENYSDPISENQRLDKIHHQINLRNRELFSRNDKKIKLIQILSRIAVLIFIPVLTILIYTRFFQSNPSDVALNKTVMNEIISPVGSRISLDLSDGTRVWLNHGSKLIYPQHFQGKTRIVKLSGEGYFDVFHNPEKPFVVETEEMQIVAKGTKFNINAYSTDNTLETTLESGKIILKDNSNRSFELKPGQHFHWDKTNNSADIKNVDIEKYICWKDGKLVFQDDGFENIANRLSRWYNVDFEFNDPRIRELTYTATFIDEPLYQILEMLEVVTPIQCRVSERNKLPDGTYSRKKIFVTYKD